MTATSDRFAPPRRARVLRRWLPCVLAVVALATGAAAGPLSRCGQIAVTVTDGWDASSGRMQLFERERGGRWRPVFKQPIAVLLGHAGLAWGRGVLGQREPGPHRKREGDGRTPAGIFRIGKIYGYNPKLAANPDYPYLKVGKWDAWPDDPENPYYNRHVVVDPRRVPKWFDSQKMRHGDEAYRFLVEIRHNADDPVPGAGSATFFHTRRGPTRPTAGCTVMRRDHLLRFIARLRAAANPHYLVMPAAEYARRAKALGLPPMP